MIKRIKILLLASRPFSWVNTAFPFAAAYLLAGGQPGPFFTVGCLFFLFPFNLLMYGVNDVYDYESDILNPRKGGIEGAKIPKPYHRFVLGASTVICLPFALYLITANLIAALILALLLIDAVAYSAPPLRLKERPFIDSVSSSFHFAGPALFGLMAAGFNQQLVPAILALFVWGLASHAFGAIQDIEPDKQAGIGSIATALGQTATSWLCIALFVLAAIITSTYGAVSYILLAALSLYPLNVWWSWRTKNFNQGWRRWMWLNLLCGFVFTQIVLWRWYGW
ncbi:prenyltransferase [Patescibacteria group bacterium]|nr:MAG: prenyltransferase [Patescibacteria group bacterium]